jgi:maltoporin
MGMMDYYVANLDGNGVGVENISLWSGILNVHYLFSYDPTVTETSTSETADSYAAKQTLAFDLQGFDAGNGSFSFILAPSYQGDNGVPDEYPEPFWGFFSTVKYNADSFFSLPGTNEYFASFGYGSGANQHVDMANWFYGTSGAGDWSFLAGYQGYSAISSVVSWRNTLYYETRSWDPNGEGNFVSFGFRPMFKQTDIFGWQLEYDLELAIDTGKTVNRITLAPTLVPTGGDVNSPVQIQAYVTYAYGDFVGGDVVAVEPGSSHGMAWGFFGSVGF